MFLLYLRVIGWRHVPAWNGFAFRRLACILCKQKDRQKKTHFRFDIHEKLFDDFIKDISFQGVIPSQLAQTTLLCSISGIVRQNPDLRMHINSFSCTPHQSFSFPIFICSSIHKGHNLVWTDALYIKAKLI